MACAYPRMAADVTADISPSERQEDQFCTSSVKRIKAAATWDFPYRRITEGEASALN